MSSIAASPALDGADPPDWLNVPLDVPRAARLIRMLSMDCCVRLVLKNALGQLVQFEALAKSAGTVVSRLLPLNMKLPLTRAGSVMSVGRAVRLLF